MGSPPRFIPKIPPKGSKMQGNTTDSATWRYKPNSIQIEVVQGCNRRCQFCGSMGVEHIIHFAEPRTIYHTCKLIRDANLNCRICLAGHGEPTLHPNLLGIVSQIRKMLPKNTIHLLTNGTVIVKKPEMVRQLFCAGVNDIIIDEYTETRGIGTAIAKNVPEIERVFQGAGVPMYAPKNPTAQRICINKPIEFKGNTPSRKLCNHCGAGMKPLKQPEKKMCSIIFRDMLVRWDGNIAICCNDFRGEYPVCNILNCATLRQAYFHERLEAARKFLMLKQRTFHPCDICDVSPIRPGLLPDALGKQTMPEPTEADMRIVREKRQALAVIVKREWEA